MIPPDVEDEIEIYGGTEFTGEWWWLANGSGVDFAGCSGTFSLRVAPDEDAIVTVTDVASAAGWLELGTGESAGLVRLHLAAAWTSAFVYPVAHGNIVLTMTDGKPITFKALDAKIYPVPSGGGATPPPQMPLIPPDSTQLSYDNPDVMLDTTAGDVDLVLPVAGVDGKELSYTVVAGAHVPVLHTGDSRTIVNPENGASATTFTPTPPVPPYTLIGGRWTFRWSTRLGKFVS